MSFEIRIDNLHYDAHAEGLTPTADYQILLWIVCDFVVIANGIEVYREIDMTPVEFAEQATAWLRSQHTCDFDFVSMESATKGLVYFHRMSDARWSVGSNVRGAPPPETIGDASLRSGLDRFLGSLPSLVDRLGVDIRPLLSLPSESA